MNTQTLLRCALLGSAFAVTALSPAFAGPSQAEKRALAIHGKHALSHMKTGTLSNAGATDPTYTVLHSFGGADGNGPGANVTLDDAGNIYGTTDFGGAHFDGVVFKLAPDGTTTVLHAFTGGSDGTSPDGAVLVRPSGTIYGTAGSGGNGDNGTLFRLSSKGNFKVLHDFALNDGSFLRGDLIRDKLGNLYGTALFGGVNGDGTVYKYGFDGTFTVLHAFNGADGEFPEHGVVSDADGNLYGVTAFGGANDNGSVYKLTPGGTLTTLYSFTGGDDGGFLYGGLDIDADGNLYGSTTDGGTNASGTVFKLTQGGVLTTLYNFTGGADGGGPEGDMLLVGNKLYSTATTGGDPSCLCGGVYEVSMDGKEKMLHAFTGADGSGYSAGLVRRHGLLYGMTASGGAHGDGTVFSVTKK